MVTIMRNFLTGKLFTSLGCAGHCVKLRGSPPLRHRQLVLSLRGPKGRSNLRDCFASLAMTNITILILTLLLGAVMPVSPSYSADTGTDFEAVDDLTVSGQEGTKNDADLEVKGVSSFAKDVFIESGILAGPYGGMGRYQNLLKYSDALGDTNGWTQDSITVTSGATLAYTAPDGTTTAEGLTASGATGVSRIYQSAALSLVNGDSVTFSVWAKAGTNTTLGLRITFSGSVDGSAYQDFTLTTQWQRFSYTRTTLNLTGYTGNTYAWIYPKTGNDSTIDSGAIYAWGAQLEQSSAPGVYVKTTTDAISASRGMISSADAVIKGNLQISGAGPHYFTTGNVGIGTTNPAAVLDVQGGIRFGASGANNIINTSTAGGAATGDLYWGNKKLSGAITIKEVDGSPNLTGIETLEFDQGTGLYVSDQGNNTARITIGSHWKELYIDGVSVGMIPVGEETLNFIKGNDVTITANSSSTPKSLTFSVEDDIDASVVRASSASGLTFYDNSSNLGMFIKSGGNVGIGTTGSSQKLEVAGAGLFSGTRNLTIDPAAGEIGSTGYLEIKSGGSSNLILNSATSQVLLAVGDKLSDSDNTAYYLDPSNSVTAMIVAGNVGIGTTAPGSRLEAVGIGTTSATSSLNIKNSAGASMLYVRDDNKVGIGTANPQSLFEINGGSGTAMRLYRDASGNWLNSIATNWYIGRDGAQTAIIGNNYVNIGNGGLVYTSGSVGIGTTSPEAKLDVAGPLRVGTAGDVNISHDLYFEDITASNIKSYGPLTIQSGNPNSNYNLVLKGTGAGKVYIDDDLEITGTTTFPSGLTVASGNITASSGNVSASSGSGTFGTLTVTGATNLATTSGNVGIGTTNPTSKLVVAGNINPSGSDTYNLGSSNSLYWNEVWADDYYGNTINARNPEDLVFAGWGGHPSISLDADEDIVLGFANGGNLYVDNDSLFVNSVSGNVGIGTTGPVAGLHVVSDSARFTGKTGNNTITIEGANASSRGYLNLVGDGATFTLNEFGGSARITYPGELQFGNTSIFDRIVMQADGDFIVNSGKIGIGTTNPGDKLEVSGNIKLSSSGNVVTWTADDADKMYLYGGAGRNKIATSYGWVTGYHAGNTAYGTNEGYHIFYTSTPGVWSERMRIDKAGNVGIGTSAPNRRLDINGSAIIYDRTATTGTTNLTIQAGAGQATGPTRLFDIFANNGTTPRFHVTDVGNVGIGTTDPSQKLEVAGNIKATQIDAAINTSGNITSSGNLQISGVGPHYISNGNVGIGTTLPGTKLDVIGGAIRTNNQLISTIATGTAPLAVTSTTVVTNLNSDLLDGAQASMTAGNSTIVQRNASGYVYANYFNTTADVTAAAASHFAIQTGTDSFIRWQTPANARTSLGLGTMATQNANAVSITGGSITGITDLAVSDGGTGASTFSANYLLKGNTMSPISSSIVYDNGTNVGIGTTGPSTLLSITGNNVAGRGQVSITSGSATDLSRMTFYKGGVTPSYIGDIYGDPANSKFVYDAPTGFSQRWSIQGSEKMTLDSGGNVGIGTTGPGQALDVVGHIRSSGNVYVGNSIYSYSNPFQIRTASTPIQILPGDNSATAVLHVQTNGNVGIGTTVPIQKLDVNGSINIASGQKYKINNFNLAATDVGAEPTLTKGNLTAGSSKIAIGGTGTGALIGAGASVDVTEANLSLNNIGGTLNVNKGGTGAGTFSANYLLKGNTTSPISSSIVYDNGTNVGIGTTGPNEKLHVAGNARLDNGGIIFYNSTGGPYTKTVLRATGADASGMRVLLDSGGPTIIGGGESADAINTNVAVSSEELYLSSDNTGANGAIKFVTSLQNNWTGRVDAMTILGNGNVGIGTTSPIADLQVGSTTASAITSSSITDDISIQQNFSSATASITVGGNLLIAKDTTTLTGATSTFNPTGVMVQIQPSTGGTAYTGKLIDLQVSPAGGSLDSKFNVDASGNVFIKGNLTTQGTQIITNTVTVDIQNNKLVLNTNQTGSPTQDATIEVERGTSTNSYLKWNETTDKWEFNDGTTTANIGSGSVTSVGLSAPADIFTVTNSPVTTTGTLTLTKVNQNANLIYAGPSSGGAAAPAFRALVDNDIPDVITINNGLLYAPTSGNVGIGTTVPRSKLDTWTGTMTGAANDYEKAQFTMSGGGTVTWGGTGNRLQWTARFIAIPVQRTTTASAGYIDINQPTTDIPAGQVFDGIARSATSAGVVLNSWEALYAAHAVGGNNTAITYYIVKYTNDFTPPSNWLLVAAINGDNNTAKLGTGVTLKPNGSWSGGIDSQYVQLQGSTPGTQQTGHLNVSGTGIFSGNVNVSGTGIFSGNVGIGTASPKTGLTLWGANSREGLSLYNIYDSLTAGLYSIISTGNAVQIRRNTDAAGNFATFTTPFIINSSDNVGIGTMSPSSGKLQVYTASGNLAYFDGTNDAYIDINGNFNAQSGIVRLGNVNGAAGLTSGSTARLALGVNNSEKMSIQNDGNVGIGTTVPAQKLDVAGVFAVDAIKKLAGVGLTNMDNIAGTSTNNFVIYSANSDAGITIYTPTSYDGSLYFGRSSDGNQGGFVYDFAAGDLGIKTNNTANQIVVKGTGSVGINTSAPEAKLDVAGPMRVSSAGDVGISHDLYFEDTTSASINSYGPLTITSGNPNSNYNLVLKGAGTGKVIVDDDFSATGNIELGDASADTISIHGTVVGASPALLVNQSAADDIVVVQDSGSDVFKILDGGNSYFTGNVGIGTTAPVNKLDVKSSGTGTNPITVTASDGSVLANIYENAGGNSGLLLKDASGTTKIDLFSGGASYFNAGNVGIGTTGPGAPLHASKTVSNGAGLTEIARLQQTGGNTGDLASLSFYGGSGSGTELARIVGGWDTGATPGMLTFWTKLDGGAITERMRITQAGYVGIGTTGPSKKLDVAGDINFTGNLYQNGSLYVASQWITSGSNIYYNTGNVGIGTTGPIRLLQVTGSNVVSDSIRFNNSTGKTLDFTAYGSTGGGTYWSGLDSVNTVAISAAVATNTTLVQLANNGIVFSGSGSAEHMRIASGGNVGIGTTNPTGRLEIAGGTLRFGDTGVTDILMGSAGSNYGRIQNDAADKWSLGYGTANTTALGTPVLTWNSSGNVGIGTTVPGATLDVDGNGSFHSDSGVKFYNTADTDWSSIDRYGVYIQSGNIWLQHNGTADLGTIRDFRLVQNSAGVIYSVNSGAVANTLYLKTGNVGIGTTNPAGKLEVVTSAGSMLAIGPSGDNDKFQIGTFSSGSPGIRSRVTDSGSASDKSLNFWGGHGGTSSTAYSYFYFNHEGVYNGTASINGMRIQGGLGAGNTGRYSSLVIDPTINNSSGANYTGIKVNINQTQTTGTDNRLIDLGVSGSTKFLVTSNGSVGIGTTAPEAKLDVQGPLRINTAGDTGVAQDLVLTNIDASTVKSYGPLTIQSGGSNDNYNLTLKGTGTGKVYVDDDLQITGDLTLPALSIPSSGTITFGADTNLYRSAANTLKTDDTLNITGNLQVTGAGPHYIQSGNVGIGTTSPATNLDVKGNAVIGSGAYLANTQLTLGSGGNSPIVFRAGTVVASLNNGDGEGPILASNYYRNNASADVFPNAAVPAWRMVMNSRADLDFMKIERAPAGSSTWSTFVNIKNDGNVGIGTTQPIAKLDFAAATNAAGGIDFGGDTNLYRSGANTLQTDDDFYIGSYLKLYTSTGNVSTGGLGDFDNNGSGRTQIGAVGPASQSGLTFSDGATFDTNLYRITANLLGTDDTFYVGGNIGIGTTGPAGKLYVLGDSSVATSVYIDNPSTALNSNLIFRENGVDKAFIRYINSTNALGSAQQNDLQISNSAGDITFTSGNVGIGTTAPSKKLDVSGDILITGTDAATPYTFSSSRDGATNLLIQNTSINTNAAMQLLLGLNDAGSGAEIDAAKFAVGKIDNTAGSLDSYLDIYTMKDGATTQRVRIDNNGNVGIGTIEPGAPLEVKSSSSGASITGLLIRNANTTTNTAAAIKFYNSTSTSFAGSSQIESTRTDVGAAGTSDLRFSNWNGSALNEIMRITGGGNVGIGTTSPGEKLEVSGNIKLTGRIRQGNMGDMAEMIALSKTALTGSLRPEPKDVVIVDQAGGIIKCNQVSSPLVIGIISTNPAHILMEGLPDSLPVALSGVVPCKVSDENGLIKPGDLLVSASISGYAMKAGPDPAPGTVIAKALEVQKEKLDSINVLVMMR